MAARRRLPPGPPREEEERETWLEEVTERADPLLSWLGVVFALLVGYQLVVDLAPGTARALEVVGWSIWGVFLLDYLARLWLAPRKLRYVRRHWLQLLMLAVPTLRVLRFLRLVRLGRALPAARVVSSSYRSAGTARRLFRSRLGYLAALSAVAAIALAQLAFLFERDHPRGVFASFGDALFWSSATLALQGDPVPASTGARVTMLVGFVFGLVVVATLAGTVGAFFVDDRRERAEVGDPA